MNTAENFAAPVWHVLHVKPRCEKKMHGYLDSLALDNYLPLASVKKIYQRRKVVFENPLFPGYVFAQFDNEQRLRVLKSQYLVRIIPVSNQARLVMELEQLKAALAANPFVAACAALARGDRVRITSGPLCGMEGTIHVFKGETRVMLTVEAIGQGVAVEASPDMLEKI